MVDLIDGLIRMMKTKSDFIGPLNFGNPDEISMNELASRVLMLTKSKLKIINNDHPLDDPRGRKADILLASQKLDWKPKYNLDMGLMNTINYSNNLNI
tara:strand:- start:131 stop:424 length:294 start_codon:yes stop_codon:yes gene_type:complete